MVYNFKNVKDLNSETIKVVPLPEGFPGRPKANIYEVITTALHGAKKWSHERFRYFLIDY